VSWVPSKDCLTPDKKANGWRRYHFWQVSFERNSLILQGMAERVGFSRAIFTICQPLFYWNANELSSPTLRPS